MQHAVGVRSHTATGPAARPIAPWPHNSLQCQRSSPSAAASNCRLIHCLRPVLHLHMCILPLLSMQVYAEFQATFADAFGPNPAKLPTDSSSTFRSLKMVAECPLPCKQTAGQQCRTFALAGLGGRCHTWTAAVTCACAGYSYTAEAGYHQWDSHAVNGCVCWKFSLITCRPSACPCSDVPHAAVSNASKGPCSSPSAEHGCSSVSAWP